MMCSFFVLIFLPDNNCVLSCVKSCHLSSVIQLMYVYTDSGYPLFTKYNDGVRLNIM